MPKTPLPPELGGHVSKQEYEKAVGKAVRREFVRHINNALERTPHPALPSGEKLSHVFDCKEQAATLRKIADQLERADERSLAPSEQRVRDRNPVTRFFSHIGDAGRYWEGRGKEPVPRTGPATNTEKRQFQSRADYWSQKAKENPACAAVQKQHEQERER